MIESQSIEDLKPANLRYRRLLYPEPLQLDLPRLYFVAQFLGPRGSGKTYSCVELLKQYETHGIRDPKTGVRCAQRVILMSLTFAANPVFTSLRGLDDSDVVSDYTDAKLLEVIEDIKHQKEETERYHKTLKAWRKFLRTEDESSMSEDELLLLYDANYAEPVRPRYVVPCVTFLVLDDLIGSDAFKSTGRSALTELVLKNRHVGVNICILTQNMKSVPRALRVNTSVWVVFRFSNAKLVDDMYDEMGSSLSLERFKELYAFATASGDHSCLVVDFTQPKGSSSAGPVPPRRYKMGWSHLLTFSSTPTVSKRNASV